MITSNPTQTPASRWSIGTFSITILLSAFLLFQIQPLVSKAILPWFGGCPAVWTTCMLFFQMLLFGGYLYAHLLQRRLGPRNQVAVHLILVAAAVAILPILPGVEYKPVDSAHPTWRILVLLTATVGLPYFALSATSPLVQAWFSSRCPGRSPYRLYALSNIGSLAALLTYPFLFEPALGLPTQSTAWSVAFVLYAVLCVAILVCLWRCNRITPAVVADDMRDGSVTWLNRFCWLALPACASLMLLAATNHICQDVAAVPFLWVMPLSLYLLSFIISFDHERWYARRFWTAATVLALAAVVSCDYVRYTYPLGLKVELILNFAALFFTCMVCHGELARLKPRPRHLTEFYLMIAAGGALGGLFVAVVAPLVFSSYLEWQFGVVASALLAIGLLFLPGRAGKRGIIYYVVIAPIVTLGLSYLFFWGFEAEPLLDRTRNFFGVVTVKEEFPNDPDKHKYYLVHGRITHGRQSADPAKRDWPTSYYGEDSGVGLALEYLHKSGHPLRVGAIGLGVGTVATYAKPGDVFRFYEINPEVLRMANKHFFYLDDCRGTCDVVLGDARLSLETEPPQKFDLLIIDAFSGDAIPTHLLTREAFDLYQRHLAPDGVIAVHISNTYLRLAPVVRALAEHCGMKAVRIVGEANEERMLDDNTWMLLTHNNDFIKAHPPQPPTSPDDDLVVPLWTDQYSNLFQILSKGIGGF